MSNLTSFNLNLSTATSGTVDVGNVSYATASFVGSGSFGLTWGSEVCAVNGYTFLTDSYTQSYSLSSSGTPLFYVTATTGSTDTVDTINRLPDRRGQISFTYINTALGWISGSQKYITLYTCSVYDYSANLLQEDGFYLLQQDGSKIILNF
jgi:hypothetical protein